MNMPKLIHVKVTPKARENSVREGVRDAYKVRLTAPPVEGKANKALIKIIAEHFNLKKSQVSIVKGIKGKEKVIRLNY